MRAVALAIVLLSKSAFADPKCASLVCDDRSAHPGVYSCDTPPCYCTDSCGGGGSTSSPNGDAAARGLAKLIGYTVLGVAFIFMPGHMAEWTSDGPRQTAKDANDGWKDHVAKRQRLVQAGEDAEKARTAYWTLDAEERASLRDARKGKAKPLKPFHPPKLRPDPVFQCNQARLLMPTVHTGGPIGPFASEQAMIAQCSALSDPPVPADPSCPDTTFRCAVGTPEVCCPRSHPILNRCNGQCYRTTDFMGGDDDGMHCATSRDCGSTLKP